MLLLCEKCGKKVNASAGEYVYYLGRMMFVCKACADRLNDEIKCARIVCAAADSKKTQAEYITDHKEAYEKFLKNIGKKIKAFL